MRSIVFNILLLLAVSIMSTPALSVQADKLKVQKITDNVYALVGQRGPMSKWNFGTNATFGVVITDDGVVLIDSGASDKAARYIHDAIKNITDKPVALVINTGSEDLRWFGNGYYKSLGAKIITSEATLVDQHKRADAMLNRLDEFIFPEYSAGTTDVYADTIFKDEKTIKVGSTTFVLKYTGPGYMPGDFFVWMPDEKIVFAGDIITTERMLAVSRESKTDSWMRAFEEIEKLKPVHVVPGHGYPADIKKARADTYNLLKDLRESVKEYMQQGGEIETVNELKQVYPLFAYERLIGYDMLLGRNVLHVYMEMEWE